jgi:3-methyl-2-oxobutanoate hydroxymethyltransferase
LNEGFKPKFLRQFAQLGEAVKNAVSDYVTAVKNVHFPNQEESY